MRTALCSLFVVLTQGTFLGTVHAETSEADALRGQICRQEVILDALNARLAELEGTEPPPCVATPGRATGDFLFRRGMDGELEILWVDTNISTDLYLYVRREVAKGSYHGNTIVTVDAPAGSGELIRIADFETYSNRQQARSRATLDLVEQEDGSIAILTTSGQVVPINALPMIVKGVGPDCDVIVLRIDKKMLMKKLFEPLSVISDNLLAHQQIALETVDREKVGAN